MTTYNLPEEVLLLIFSLADDRNEAEIYQHVCRAWYRPAHITLLHEVDLEQFDMVEQFIRSIDYNPNPLYLKAVKRINISSIDDSPPTTSFDEEMTKKLFFRFPNLENVSINSAIVILGSFNDKLCQEFLQRCPKNVTFNIGAYYNRKLYYKTLKKVQLIVTDIDNDSLPETIIIEDIVTSFPRLNSIKGNYSSLDSFEKCLPLVQKLPYTKRISLQNYSQEDDEFAEKYLASITKEEQHQLVEKLSKIDTLNWETACVDFNSLKFIGKYLTGLNQFDMCFDLVEPWNNQQQQRFCTAALDLLRSKRNYKLRLQLPRKDDGLDEDDDDENDPNKYIAFVVQQMKTQALQLSLTQNDLTNTMDLDSNRQEFMNISALTFDDPPNGLFSAKVPLDSVEEFTLTIQDRYEQEITFAYVEYYESILAALPSLKQATVEIPADFYDKRSSSRKQKIACRQLQTLILLGTPNAKFQSFLSKCLYLFPQLKHMYILYHCGVWKENIGTIQMGLERFSLEKLTLDVTPLKMTINNELDKDQFTKDDFFVVAVKISNNKEMYLYKVSFDLSRVIKIVDNDLKRLKCGKDYFRVSISIASLEQLELYMYRYGTPKEEDSNYLDVGKYSTQILIV